MVTLIEEGIRVLFNELDENSKIMKYDQVLAEDDFSVQLRTKLTNTKNWGEECNRWVEKFTNQTNSKYIVRTSKAQGERMDFRKVYVCKANGGKNGNTCPSKIDIKIKKVTTNTLKKDQLLRKGYNSVIKVVFSHSHER